MNNSVRMIKYPKICKRSFYKHMDISEKISLFVPGRLCLFGEHTDWAGMYRTTNSSLVKGQAIVTGIEQGIYADAEKCDRFIVTSDLDLYHGHDLESPMDSKRLIEVSKDGGFFSYVAGTASYINDNYSVGGVKINVKKMDLPVKSGLSSSAAICVLVARAFNQLYHLKMNTKGEMQAAFRGEQRTPSRCGRLDQACAYGVKPVLMDFDGFESDSRELHIGSTFYWVITNLMSSKNTVKILADLNKCYPFAETDKEKRVQEALGVDNLRLIEEAVKDLESGDAPAVGKLMDDWQKNFDIKVMPVCDELKAPVLHSVLNDPEIRKYIYGAKGVGSQGDGSVQFLAKGKEDVEKLRCYLNEELHMPSFVLTLKPGQSVKRAIVPLAGYGTRVFPATKSIKKCFLPILDRDGILKPAIMILLEQLLDAGIEEICLVIGKEDKEEFDRFFAPLSDELKEKLPTEKKEVESGIARIARHINYVYQKERLGFGHAVWLCRKFTQDDPVLLMLGDFLYKSDANTNCCRQVIDSFKECGKTLVSVHEISLENVVHYGVLHGQWENTDETMMKVDMMKEKPTDDYAEEYLGVEDPRGGKHYYATFGQYVLTPEVFCALEEMIRNGEAEQTSGNHQIHEYELTSALEEVMKKDNMYAFKPEGRCFDIGLPDTYRDTMIEFSK